jgi:dCMP deaminase
MRKMAIHITQRQPSMRLENEAKAMTKWDRRLCELSQFIAAWSKDPQAKVGAVVVSKRGAAVGLGYNGFPGGVEDSTERLENDQIKLDMVIHAEQNAIINAGSRTEGGTLYVWGKPICSRCAGFIIQSGIKRVVAMNPMSVHRTSKWLLTGRRAIEMFEEAAIDVCFYKCTLRNPK